METNVFTEKEYPISLIWVFKRSIITFAISVVPIIFGFYFPYFLIAVSAVLIINPLICQLIRRNFHFSTGDKFLYVKQGVLSKEERNLPYGVIQNVIVEQDLFDRIFKIATLSIENASQGAGADAPKKFLDTTHTADSFTADSLGFAGNLVNMPGLSKADAESLKEIILRKVKENPIDDSQSGL